MTTTSRNPVCQTCGGEINQREQYWVDTHDTSAGPYFHLTDECWPGDPDLRYPHANYVMPHPAPELSDRQFDVAQRAAHLFLTPVREGRVDDDVAPQFHALAQEIAEGWCLEETPELTVDRVWTTLDNLERAKAQETSAHHDALAGGGIVSVC